MLAYPLAQTMRCAKCHEEKAARDIRWFKPFDSAEHPGVKNSPRDVVETTSADPHAEPWCLECSGSVFRTQ